MSDPVRRRIRRPLALAALLVTLLAAASGSMSFASGKEAQTPERLGAAIVHGLDWIDRHPASVRDGGLSDVLDEGVSFRVLARLQTDAAARERFTTRFIERMATLDTLPEFTQWVNTGRKPLTDYYHLVLAAYLMQQAGTPSGLQEVIVAQAQWVLTHSRHCDPTKRLTIALFLERLDEEPIISLPAALSASRIERIARGNAPALPATNAGPQQQHAAALELYALVHEVVALTDFGHQPSPPWLANRQPALNDYLVHAVAWAGGAGNIDLLSELLLTALFLDAPLQEILPDSVELLLSSQQADGSWGSAPTVRANKYRHAVFTATTALQGILNGTRSD